MYVYLCLYVNIYPLVYFLGFSVEGYFGLFGKQG